MLEREREQKDKKEEKKNLCKMCLLYVSHHQWSLYFECFTRFMCVWTLYHCIHVLFEVKVYKIERREDTKFYLSLLWSGGCRVTHPHPATHCVFIYNSAPRRDTCQFYRNTTCFSLPFEKKRRSTSF